MAMLYPGHRAVNGTVPGIVLKFETDVIQNQYSPLHGPHYDRLGPVAEPAVLLQHRSKVPKAQNLAAKPNCVICTEHADAAVIVEGTARLTREPSLLKRLAGLYQKKYGWDMSNFAEPVYAVRPRVAFGLYEKKFMASATRWKFP